MATEPGPQGPQQPNTPAPGTIVDMSSGEKKHSTTGKSKGNKKIDAKQTITIEQLQEMLNKHYGETTAYFVKSTGDFAEKITKAAEESGNKAFADTIRGVKPNTLWSKFRLHTRRTISFGDVYWIVAGGVVLAVVYNGLAYLFRNKVAFPFAKEFKTGIAADRRSVGMNGATKSRVQMPMRAA